MSISIFYLPNYKDMTHVSPECYLAGKACSCHNNELEDFLPIWKAITAGNFPGSAMKLRRRIRDEEYSMYPIVFIDSHYWPAKDGAKAHGYTCVHVVQQQKQNVLHCKTYQNRFIDRNIGVIILDKTTLYDHASEPDFKYWFYEKDTRTELPKSVLSEFTAERKGVFLSIEKFAELPVTLPCHEPIQVDMEEYEHKYVRYSGYLNGDTINKLIEQYVFPGTDSIGCKLIEWQGSWNFVIHDDYGQKMFKVNSEDAEAFIKQNFADDNDMCSEIKRKYSTVLEEQPDELDFYTDLLEAGIDIIKVRKYMGDEVANHMEEFCKEHGLI